MPLFNQARDLEIGGGVFNDIQGHQYIIHLHGIDLAALNHATEHFANVDQHRAILEVLLEQVKDLVLKVDGQASQIATPLTAEEMKNVNRSEQALISGRCREHNHPLLEQCLLTPRKRHHNYSHERLGLEAISFRKDSISTPGNGRCHSPRTRIWRTCCCYS